MKWLRGVMRKFSMKTFGFQASLSTVKDFESECCKWRGKIQNFSAFDQSQSMTLNFKRIWSRGGWIKLPFSIETRVARVEINEFAPFLWKSTKTVSNLCFDAFWRWKVKKDDRTKEGIFTILIKSQTNIKFKCNKLKLVAMCNDLISRSCCPIMWNDLKDVSTLS